MKKGGDREAHWAGGGCRGDVSTAHLSHGETAFSRKEQRDVRDGSIKVGERIKGRGLQGRIDKGSGMPEHGSTLLELYGQKEGKPPQE